MIFRWSRSTWNSKQGIVIPYDKIEHFIGGFILFVILWSFINHNSVISLVGVAVGITIWEIKDGLMPWEKYGFWGGEGFCWKDWVATFAGGLLAFGIDRILK